MVGYARAFSGVDVTKGTVLVLARNAYVLKDQVEPLLRAQGVVYEKNGHPSISAAVLGSIQAWEQLRRGERVTVEQVRSAYKYMRSGHAIKRGYKELQQHADDMTVDINWLNINGGLLLNTPWFDAMQLLPQEDMHYLRAARQRGEKLTEKPRVTVSTIHGSKGGEAEHVVLLKEMATRTYREMNKWPDDERRVWYVAATRAKERLTIVDAQTPRRVPWL